MVRRPSKAQPTWTDVKAKLASFDQTGLLGLVHELYAAHKDNQTFLHTRFALGEDVLKPYKETIGRWLWPDVFRKQNTSVAKAKQAVSNYKKAVGDPIGLAECSRDSLITRLDRVRGISHQFGHGVGDDMDSVLAKYAKRGD